MSHSYQPILDDGEESSTASTIKTSIKYVFCLAIILGVSFLVSEKMLQDPKLMLSSIDAEFNARKGTGLTFSFAREGYTPLSYMDSNGGSDLFKYSVISRHMGVLEPNVENNLYVSNADPTQASYTFKYTVCPYDPDTGKPDTQRCETGRASTTDPKTVTVKCDPYDVYEVKINEYLTDETTVVSNTDEISGTAVCMYVRRDIKSLTNSDLSTVMDTMYQMWSLTEEDGQKLYGDDFHSIDWFTVAHMYHNGQQDADHMNDGIGFLAQHIKLTELFEKSMQSIHEGITLPYWDYTAETGDLTDSVMFTEDTFGSLVTPTDDSRGWVYNDDSIIDASIPDGRWEKVKATVAAADDDLADAFGSYRGGWSMNPSPYVSRYTTKNAELPTCSDFYGMMQISDYADFLDLAAHTPHDKVRSAIGSTYGCDKMDDLVSAGLVYSEAQQTLCAGWSTFLKELYRDHYITPKSSCVTGVFYLDSSIKCGFTCDADQKEDMLTRMKELLNWDGVTDSVNTEDDIKYFVPSTVNASGWDEMYDFVCGGDGYRIFSGDHMSAAATSDPSFWLVHPNIERLWQTKLMGGGFAAVDWPKELPKICEKSTCYEDEYGAKDEYKECCDGHFESDQMLDFINRNISQGYYSTNREIMVKIDPSSVSYLNAYVYDDVSFSHCEDDFSALMYSMLKR